MTALAQLAGVEPERDRYGRYVIPHPRTGAKVSWTRATTFAKSVSDTTGIEKWGKRMVARGMSLRPDLASEAAALVDIDAKSAKATLAKVADAAMEHAGGSSAARTGTALHAMTEQLDRGTATVLELPEAHRADLAAYADAMTANGVRINPAWIEQVVTVEDLLVAGTFDRIVTVDGVNYIADLKTGQDLGYSWAEIPVQLALYAHAETIYDFATGHHVPMPDVDQARALVMHAPAGRGTCQLYWVDIEAGWETVQLCQAVRAWRKNAKKCAARFGEPVTHVIDRTEWLVGRLATLKGQPAAEHVVRLAWPQGCAGKPPWSAEHQDAIAAALSQGEAVVQAPFADPAPVAPEVVPPAPEPDEPNVPAVRPGDAPEDGGDVTAAVCLKVKKQAQALNGAKAQVLRRWIVEGTEAGRPFLPPKQPIWPARIYHATLAAIAAVEHLWDDDDPDALVRAALSLTIGEDVQPAWSTGGLLGSLTPDEARRLTKIAAAFRDADAATCAALTERLPAAS